LKTGWNLLNGMNFEYKIKDSLKIYKRHISKIVTFFALILGLNTIIQIIFLAGVGGALSYLHITEGFGKFIDMIASGEFLLFLETLIDQTTFIAIIMITLIVAVIGGLAGFSFIIGGFIKLIRDLIVEEESSLGNALKGSAKYFKRIFLLYVFGGIIGLLGIVIPIGIGQVSILAGILVGIFSILIIVILYLVFFLFAQEIIVIDDVGILDGMWGSFEFFKSNILEIIGLIVLAVLTSVILGMFNQLVTFVLTIQIESMTYLITLLIVSPIIMILKIRMYTDYRGMGSTQSVDTNIKPWIKNGLYKSWSTSILFIKNHPALIGISIVIFTIGTIGGWHIGDTIIPYDLTDISLPPNIDVPYQEFGVGGNFASMFLYLMFHNWTVAIGITFSGLVYGIPTIGALLFNGVIIGIVSALIGDITFVAIGILPHGIIEIPAISIAGAMGLSLGISFKNYISGDIDVDTLGDKMENIMYALVGVFPLFLIAAIIEAFITPLLLSIYAGGPLI